MSKLKDQRVFCLQRRDLYTLGAPWVTMHPHRRFSHNDMVCKIDELSARDTEGYEFRGYAPAFEQVVTLDTPVFDDEADDMPVVHIHTRMSDFPGSVLPPTGWPLLVHMLGQGERVGVAA